MYRKIYKKTTTNERTTLSCKFISPLNRRHKNLLKRNYLRPLKKFPLTFIRRLVVADGRSKHLKDENKSIDGKCHTKQIENTPRRDPHLSENRNLGSYVTSKSYIDIFNQCVHLKKKS